MNIKVKDVIFSEIHGTSTSQNAIVLNCCEAGCSNIVMKNVSIMPSTPGKEVQAFCQNVNGREESTVPNVPCLSKSN